MIRSSYEMLFDLQDQRSDFMMCITEKRMHVYHYYYYYHCVSRKNWTYIWYFDVVFDDCFDVQCVIM